MVFLGWSTFRVIPIDDPKLLTPEKSGLEVFLKIFWEKRLPDFKKGYISFKTNNHAVILIVLPRENGWRGFVIF